MVRLTLVVLASRLQKEFGSNCLNCVMPQTTASGIPARGLQANIIKVEMIMASGRVRPGIRTFRLFRDVLVCLNFIRN